jgi:3-deoxy-7-phosphoheptulonate synthase
MILTLKEKTGKDITSSLAEKYRAVIVENSGKTLLVTPFSLKEVVPEDEKYIDSVFVAGSDIQLASRKFMPQTREIQLGKTLIGGNHRNTMIAIGPCSVESEEQITATAEYIQSLGLKTLRAGSFKPRTSPYTFQGMGSRGLKLLDAIRRKYGFTVITEVRDSTHADEVIEFADVIQIGAKSMYDHGILKKCGKANKPVLLKRGFGSSLQEFVQAAEFILSGGNPQVMLCERGIRTFETKTRFSLDLCGVAYLKEHVNLPVILDPSHAMGYAYGVPDLARACMAMDVDGLLIEVHPQPEKALSDASQQLSHDQFSELFKTLTPIAGAVNRNIV